MDTSDEETDIETQIVQKVEYFVLGDYSKPPRSEYLLNVAKQAKGWVPLSVLLRLDQVRVLSTDPKYIARLLRERSTDLQVSDDNDAVRKKPETPIPTDDEVTRCQKERYVYCEGIPLNQSKKAVFNFFNSFGEVERIEAFKKWNHTTERLGKDGSYFVLYRDKDSAQYFMSTEPLLYFTDILLTKSWRYDVEDYSNSGAPQKKLPAPPPPHLLKIPGVVPEQQPLMVQVPVTTTEVTTVATVATTEVAIVATTEVATVTTTEVATVATTEVAIVATTDVVIIGGCPKCRTGMMKYSFTCCGIVLATLCFPIGLVCCYLMRKKKCINCGAML